MKILVMTSVYPSPNDDKSVSITPVVHYFAKEWVSMGHQVIVIFNANRYPGVFNMIPEKAKKTLMSKFSFVPLVNNDGEDMSYQMDNVNIYKLPMLKIIPRGLFSNKQIIKQYDKIIETLDNNNFIPDVIISHWDNPQLQLSSMLKRRFKVKNVQVFHGLGNLKKNYKGKVLLKELKNVDVFGFRSLKMKEEFHDLYGKPPKEFICYSGIPCNYVLDNKSQSHKKFNEKTHKYLYVGSLIKRKNPDTILRALSKIKNEKKFELNIVGEGDMKQELENLAKELGIEKNVNFLGKIPREEVINLMRESECFTMVSNNEIFGLVYLEAMLQGCIVICSKNEGFDGIIENGNNGFTCTAGDIDELANIYRRIDLLSKETKNEIATRAMKTAEYYTDYQVAKDYLDNIS